MATPEDWHRRASAATGIYPREEAATEAKRITLRDTDSGDTVTHAHSRVTNYATLCGCSDDDDVMEPVPTPRGQKINCDTCRQIVEDARRFRSSDFEKPR